MRIAEVLGGWGGAALRELVDTLRLVTADQGADPTLRNQAALRLTTLETESREYGVAVLCDLAEDLGTDAWNRLWAAQHLSRLGGDAGHVEVLP